MFANENAANSLPRPHCKGNVCMRKSESISFKNPPSSAGDAGPISSRGTKIPHGTWQLSSLVTAKEKPAQQNEDPVWSEISKQNYFFNGGEIWTEDSWTPGSHQYRVRR